MRHTFETDVERPQRRTEYRCEVAVLRVRAHATTGFDHRSFRERPLDGCQPGATLHAARAIGHGVAQERLTTVVDLADRLRIHVRRRDEWQSAMALLCD